MKINVSSEGLEQIIEALQLSYEKKIKKAEQTARRTPKMEKELRACQTVLQEMLAQRRYVFTHEKASAAIR